MKKAKWVVPTIYIIFLMLPIYWLLNMSFKTTTEIINTYTLWPQEFTLDNYKKIFTDSTWYLSLIHISDPTRQEAISCAGVGV